MRLVRQPTKTWKNFASTNPIKTARFQVELLEDRSTPAAVYPYLEPPPAPSPTPTTTVIPNYLGGTQPANTYVAAPTTPTNLIEPLSVATPILSDYLPVSQLESALGNPNFSALWNSLTTTASTASVSIDSAELSGDVGLNLAQSSPLIGMPTFRANPLYAGINGNGFSTVIIDSGIDRDHPFFGPDNNSNGIADRIVYNYDFFGADDADASDENGHGTNVASIATSSDATRPGMAPASNIIALKVFDASGNGNFGDIEQALQWVVANANTYNIASVNMSLGNNANYSVATDPGFGVSDEIAALAAMNVIVVSSSGNSFFTFGSAQGASYPAADPNSLSIGAVFDANAGGFSYSSGAVANTSGPDRIAPFSQRSATLTTVFAPGAPITGAGLNGGLLTQHGTSQAAPHISGIVTLMQQLAAQRLGRRLTLAELRTLLPSTGVTINDGDDEDDNVTNTGVNFKRVDVPALANAVYNLGAAPPSSSFDGIGFDTDAGLNGFYHIPPDPHGAAGPTQVVSVVNTSIQWHTKAGVLQNSQRLGRNASNSVVGSFFESLNPANGLFDPKVIYDQHSNRFIVVALERVDLGSNNAGNVSRVLLAVSDNSDPNGTWFYQAIDAKETIGGFDTWFDYPGLAVDEEAIYLTGNFFRFGTNAGAATRLFILDKVGLYSGGSSSVVRVDPYQAAGLNANTSNTLQPAHTFGTPAGATGTFFVSAGWSDGNNNDFLHVIRIDNPLSVNRTFNGQFLSVGGDVFNFNYLDAPQLGTATRIDTGDSRALQAVWRNNNLYAVHTTIPNAGTNANTETARWYRINTTNVAALALADTGEVGAEDLGAGTYTYYPALAVDSAGNMGIGFSASGANLYGGAYFAARLATDTPGTIGATQTVAVGLDFYIRTFGGARNRWGDYSGASIDPTDDSTMWIFNEYADTRGTLISGEDGRWRTHWKSFNLSDVSAPTVTAVFARGSAWNGAFLNHLQTSGQGDANLGWRIPPASQLTVLPWININQISIQFSETVTVTQADLRVLGARVAERTISGFSYNPTTFVGTWTLTNPINSEKLRLWLNSGATAVRDSAGNALDGEWANNGAGADTFPSGNGSAGGVFQFRINVLPGDADLSTGVNAIDVGRATQSQNAIPGNANYFSSRDVDGNAIIDAADLAAIRARRNLTDATLPATNPAVNPSGAGATNSGPISSATSTSLVSAGSGPSPSTASASVLVSNSTTAAVSSVDRQRGRTGAGLPAAAVDLALASL